MRNKIEAAIRSSKADYTEIRLEEREATTVSYRGAELENANPIIDAGGIVRCMCRDGGWGIATFNDRDDLTTKIEQAYQCAKVAQSETPIELALTPIVEDKITVALERDFRGVSLAEKKALIEGYNAILLQHSDKIIDSMAVYNDTFSRILFANSEGSFIEEERPMVTVYMVAIARDGDNVQQAAESRSAQNGFQFLQGHEDLVHTVAKRAVDLLSAETVVGGQYPVIVNQELGLSLIHI